MLMDTALDRVIMEKVILTDYSQYPPVIILERNPASIPHFLVKNLSRYPLVEEWLRSHFDFGNSSIPEIVSKHLYFLDTSVEKKYPKVPFLVFDETNNDYRGIEKLRKEYHSASIINQFLLFMDQPNGKCLLLYHAYMEGTTVAYLERKNQQWELVSKKMQYIE